MTASLALAVPLSINFAYGLDLHPVPLKTAHEFPLEAEGGWAGHGHVGANHSSRRPGRVGCPIAKELWQIWLRNWAFLFRVDEFLEVPDLSDGNGRSGRSTLDSTPA